MQKAGAGGWIVIGIALLVLGWLLKSNLLEAILDIVGWIIMIVGVIAVILGGVSLITGKKGQSGGY